MKAHITWTYVANYGRRALVVPVESTSFDDIAAAIKSQFTGYSVDFKVKATFHVFIPLYLDMSYTIVEASEVWEYED